MYKREDSSVMWWGGVRCVWADGYDGYKMIINAEALRRPETNGWMKLVWCFLIVKADHEKNFSLD